MRVGSMPLGIGGRAPPSAFRRGRDLCRLCLGEHRLGPLEPAVELAQRHQTLAVADVEDQDRHVRAEHAGDPLALAVHQAVDPRHRALGDQRDTGAADRTEHQVAGARVDGDGLLLDEPTAADVLHHLAGDAGLARGALVGEPLRAAGHDDQGEEHAERDAEDGEVHRVPERQPDEEGHEHDRDEAAEHPQRQQRVRLPRHREDLTQRRQPPGLLRRGSLLLGAGCGHDRQDTCCSRHPPVGVRPRSGRRPPAGPAPAPPGAPAPRADPRRGRPSPGPRAARRGRTSGRAGRT